MLELDKIDEIDRLNNTCPRCLESIPDRISHHCSVGVAAPDLSTPIVVVRTESYEILEWLRQIHSILEAIEISLRK